jgi:ethanolamine transporter
MDKKGVMLNSAFAVSAAFTFAAHLAYTMAVNSSMIFPMITGKIVSGITALILAIAVSKNYEKIS